MISILQETAWKELTGKLDRLPHALLLHGMPGVGKLALADLFGQYLLCERPGQGKVPCGACEGCRWFLGGNHPDARYLEPEAIARRAAIAPEEEGEEGKPRERKAPSVQIRIEQARALTDFVNIASHRGGRRVAIIHPAEAMNPSTANSLLKNLEEPPPGAVFILVSHRPASLLPTIRSRCVSVAVPLPEAAKSVAWLSAQGVPDAERWLAYAGGAPLRALEYARGERGAAIERVLRGIASNDRFAMAAVKDRDDLDPLAEVLQKIALDRAFAALTGRSKYSLAAAGSNTVNPRAWLDYARAMGKNRLLASHPLNPRLFATDLVAGMPEN